MPLSGHSIEPHGIESASPARSGDEWETPVAAPMLLNLLPKKPRTEVRGDHLSLPRDLIPICGMTDALSFL